VLPAVLVLADGLDVDRLVGAGLVYLHLVEHRLEDGALVPGALYGDARLHHPLKLHQGLARLDDVHRGLQVR